MKHAVEMNVDLYSMYNILNGSTFTLMATFKLVFKL